MKEKSKKQPNLKTRLVFLYIGSFIVSIAPLLVILIIRWDNYTKTPGDTVKLCVGGVAKLRQRKKRRSNRKPKKTRESLPDKRPSLTTAAHTKLPRNSKATPTKSRETMTSRNNSKRLVAQRILMIPQRFRMAQLLKSRRIIEARMTLIGGTMLVRSC